MQTSAGLPRADKELLFSLHKTFSRYHHSNVDVPVTGLSVAAVRGMVKAHSRAEKVRVHPSLVQMRGMSNAIALGAHAREQGAALESLDLSGCRSLSEHALLDYFTTIDTIRCCSNLAPGILLVLITTSASQASIVPFMQQHVALQSTNRAALE